MKRPSERALDLAESILDHVRYGLTRADALYELAQDKLAGLARQTGFDGRLLIMAEPEIAIGDCRIEWGRDPESPNPLCAGPPPALRRHSACCLLCRMAVFAADPKLRLRLPQTAPQLLCLILCRQIWLKPPASSADKAFPLPYPWSP